MMLMELAGMLLLPCWSMGLPQSTTGPRRCVEYESEGYYCVPQNQCIDNVIDQSGSFLISVRTASDEDALRSSCPKIDQTCCKLEDDSRPQCGRRNTGGLSPKTQRNESYQSHFGEWPHVCILLEKGDEEIASLYRAGASLIGDDIVVTGADKVFNNMASGMMLEDPEIFIVRCGDYDIKNYQEQRHHIERSVKKILVHPDFNLSTQENSVAVLILEDKFTIDDFIRPMCVPNPKEPISTDAECYAQGWGKRSFDGDYQTIQKNQLLRLVPHSQCENLLQKTRLTEWFQLHQSFVCAGGPEGDGGDTCIGDGGSPLVCKQTARADSFVQVGIVSWGIECNRESPGVYVDLSKAMCWIDEAVSCYKNPQVSAFEFSSGVCDKSAPFAC